MMIAATPRHPLGIKNWNMSCLLVGELAAGLKNVLNTKSRSPILEKTVTIMLLEMIGKLICFQYVTIEGTIKEFRRARKTVPSSRTVTILLR